MDGSKKNDPMLNLPDINLLASREIQPILTKVHDEKLQFRLGRSR
jgi:hypothetical protein